MESQFPPIPEPPLELPLVATPPPLWGQIGEEIFKPWGEKGFWKGFWAAFTGALAMAASQIITIVVSLLGPIAAKGAEAIYKGETASQPAFNRLGEAAIAKIFGVQVDLGDVGRPGQHERRTGAAKTLGEGIMRGLFGDFGGADPRMIEPSSAGAEKFLTSMTQVALEGWIEGWLGELFSCGQLETFGDLDDIVVQALGLGRLSRRVMAPVVSILAETPFTWKLNKIYRPTLLSTSETIRQFLRGRYTRERLFQNLALAGYKDEDIEALLAVHQQHFSVSELLVLSETATWDERECVQDLRDQGYSEGNAKTALALAKAQKIDVYRRQIAGVAGAAFESRDIEEAQFRQILSTLSLPDYEAEWLFKVWGFRREFRVKHLSTGDVADAVKRGILTIYDFRANLLKQGYSPQDVQTQELTLLAEITDKLSADEAKRKAAEEKAAAAARKAAEREAKRKEAEAQLALGAISLSEMEALVRRGLRTIEEYRDFLRKHNFLADDVADLAELLQDKISEALLDKVRREQLAAQAAKRKISLADLERAVKLGFMSVDEYRSQLAAAGFSDPDRDLLARMLQRELDQAREAEAQRKAAQARLAERHIALGDLERAVRLGIRSVDSYRAYLVTQGFDADDADLMADLVRHDIAQDQAARDRRAAVEAKLKKKKISLSEYEQAVRAGLRGIADYRTMLLAEGYTEQDVDLLARLLQLQLDADKEAAERRQAAEARLAQRNISLADVERAVKLGVVPVPDYKAMLKREGFSDDDQAILVQSLLAQLAQVRDAEAKRAAAARQAAARKISLSDFERAVRLGLRTLPEYQALLTELGFGPPDQATLMALLSLAVAQDQAARQKREQVDAEVRTRGLSLAQWEHSVLEGLRTLPEYQAWLSDQGYPREDVQTLAALLQLQIAEQAARQQGTKP